VPPDATKAAEWVNTVAIPKLFDALTSSEKEEALNIDELKAGHDICVKELWTKIAHREETIHTLDVEIDRLRAELARAVEQITHAGQREKDLTLEIETLKASLASQAESMDALVQTIEAEVDAQTEPSQEPGSEAEDSKCSPLLQAFNKLHLPERERQTPVETPATPRRERQKPLAQPSAKVNADPGDEQEPFPVDADKPSWVYIYSVGEALTVIELASKKLKVSQIVHETQIPLSIVEMVLRDWEPEISDLKRKSDISRNIAFEKLKTNLRVGANS
jgi:regulator of replication initiation timing